MREIEYVICPVDKFERDGQKYLTKGEKYEILWQSNDQKSFEILCDDKTKIFCLFKHCAHIHNLNWILL